MKKKVYFTIIGVGALLAIIGFIPGRMSGIWGILIAGITGALYYFNSRNEKRVQERLQNEEPGSDQSAGGASADTEPETPSSTNETTDEETEE